MGIKEAYKKIAMEHEAMCNAVSKDSKAFLLGGAAMGLQDAMEIIEEECPEVLKEDKK